MGSRPKSQAILSRGLKQIAMLEKKIAAACSAFVSIDQTHLSRLRRVYRARCYFLGLSISNKVGSLALFLPFQNDQIVTAGSLLFCVFIIFQFENKVEYLLPFRPVYYKVLRHEPDGVLVRQIRLPVDESLLKRKRIEKVIGSPASATHLTGQQRGEPETDCGIN